MHSSSRASSIPSPLDIAEDRSSLTYVHVPPFKHGHTKPVVVPAASGGANAVVATVVSMRELALLDVDSLSASSLLRRDAAERLLLLDRCKPTGAGTRSGDVESVM